MPKLRHTRKMPHQNSKTTCFLLFFSGHGVLSRMSLMQIATLFAYLFAKSTVRQGNDPLQDVSNIFISDKDTFCNDKGMQV